MAISTRARSMLCLVVGLAAAACYPSAAPLDSTPTKELDERLLGAWRCLSAHPGEPDKVAKLTVDRVRDRVYGATFRVPDEDPDRYEAYASSVDKTTLLNVKHVAAGAQDLTPWVFVRYTLLGPDVLHLEVVSDDALKGAADSPSAIRSALQRLEGNPALYGDLCTCVRAPTPKGQSAGAGR